MKTSTSITEALKIKEEDPERFYEYYLYITEIMKKEKEEIDKLKDQSTGGSGESDTFRLRDMPEDFYSEVEEIKDE